MKYLLFICIALATGCSSLSRKHIYHTHYGDIDIDTMEVALYDYDKQPCYIVHVVEKDSFIWDGVVKYLNCPEVFFYCPSKDCYYMSSPDNTGRMTITEYDPEFNYYYWLED